MDTEPNADEVPEMADDVILEEPVVVQAVADHWDIQAVLSCLQDNVLYVAAVVAVILAVMIILCVVCSKQAAKKKKE